MFVDDGLDTHFEFENTLPKEQPRAEKKFEICQDFQRGRCTLGDACPKRHVMSGMRYVQTKVCKHWLRGTCANGENCLYLHEYDQRFVPVCAFYERIGECSNPECPFVHALPADKKAECAAYRRGFCPAGPRCPLRHVPVQACPFYMAGFCPLGPRCPLGHPIQELYDRATVSKRILAKMMVERANDPTFNPSATCYRSGCLDPGHLAPNCPGPQHSVLHKQLAQLQEPGQPVATLEAENRGPRRCCFLCHEEGHTVRDCPMNMGKNLTTKRRARPFGSGGMGGGMGGGGGGGRNRQYNR